MSQSPPPLPDRTGGGEASWSPAPPPLPGSAGSPVLPPLPSQQAPADHASAPAAPSMLPEPPPLPDPAPMPDPGALVDPSVLHHTENTRTYPCVACGGMVVFRPERDQLVCASCGTAAPMTASRELGQVVKHDLARAMSALRQRLAKSEAPVGNKEIVCQSCGGHTQFDGTLTAIRCPYCNTPIQRDDIQDSPVRLPLDGVLPLRIGEPQARELIEAWINGRRLAPNEFKKYREIGSFTSIYLPYFSYDADTSTQYTGRRGEYYYVTVGSGENQRRERRTRWYSASGVVSNRFRDVEGLASQSLDDKKVAELSPWPLDQVLPYSPEFVAGHLSRTYDVDAAQVHKDQVGPAMRSSISNTVRRDIGGDTQQINNMNVTYRMLKYAQVLLPVWLLTVTYKHQPYQVYVNGITGEVQGHRPWSVVKLTLLALLVVVFFALVIGLYVYTQ